MNTLRFCLFCFVLVFDIKGVAMAMAVAAMNSKNDRSMFSSSVASSVTESGGVLGGCNFTIPRSTIKLLKVETTAEVGGDGGGAARVSAWVDSMRASSPPRVRSTITSPSTLSQTGDEQNSWNLSHPSAINMFEEITNASKGKQIVMFLDYDGTLSPIVEDPDKAFMSNEMREAVRAVAKYFPTAIVSGRSRHKVYSFVKLAELYYAGSHGMDIKGPSKRNKYKNAINQAVLYQPASAFVPMIAEVCKILVKKTKSISGAKVENNKFCLSVHFRCVEEKSWDALAKQVSLVLDEYPELKLTQGRKVLEIKPDIKWDKGKALEFLLKSLGYANNSSEVLPVYIGDDRTDEDAFKVLRDRGQGQGIGILVSKVPKETKASYTLQEPAEVKDFLQRLVKWKRMTSLQSQRMEA
uniref:probable trehalose-phosphate phosphatase C isoform X1 n=2 Tax=Fragaria vesca subsp. vesca TaxID=101020 RepID=UPI0005C7EE95|nr:PREDICTED: probable trehalose-phosphate phosphatase C isoform X1 [Fragaria vesca subsp. vesca]